MIPVYACLTCSVWEHIDCLNEALVYDQKNDDNTELRVKLTANQKEKKWKGQTSFQLLILECLPSHLMIRWSYSLNDVECDYYAQGWL